MRPPRVLAVGLCAAGAAVIFGFIASPPGTARPARPPSTIDLGFEAAPVELNLRGKNRRLVGRGSYLVNIAGGCVECHTNPPFAPGGDPYQGQPKQINTANYLAGGTPFGPGIVSLNLTPDAESGLPADHNYPEFRAQMRTGQNHHGTSEILQVMPWPAYRNMTDLDLRSIYEYLRAIPHAEPPSTD